MVPQYEQDILLHYTTLNISRKFAVVCALTPASFTKTDFRSQWWRAMRILFLTFLAFRTLTHKGLCCMISKPERRSKGIVYVHIASSMACWAFSFLSWSASEWKFSMHCADHIWRHITAPAQLFGKWSWSGVSPNYINLNSRKPYQLLAFSARHGSTIFVLTSEQTLLRIFNHHFVFAEWTFFKVFQPSRLYFPSLFNPFIQTEKLWTKTSLDFWFGKR